MRHAEEIDLAPGVTVTRLGLGASAIGGLFAPVAPDDARGVVRRALELGLRYVDTAPLYGLGASERYVGEVLDGLPRDSFTLSTKVGRLLRSDAVDPEALPAGVWHVSSDLRPVFDFSPDGVRRSLVESLDRLGLDRIDIAFVHDPDGHLELALSAALPTLVALRETGIVGAVGVGMNDAAALSRVVREARPDCILAAGRYTLLDQTALTELLPLCLEEGVAVVVGGVFNSGVLADPSPGARFDYVQAAPDIVARAKRAADVCASHGVPLPAAALQFPLGHPAVTAVLTGVRAVAELEENVRLFDLELPADLWDELVHENIVGEGVPLPVGAT